ncbi:uncharacterized protein V1518DRAFT_408072 [Limtongia smithiae]|uniref:uncharacterized protein n=1 Tax=Limtongia smithiae TaxID=1125753 RepID=UPI0034CEFBFB
MISPLLPDSCADTSTHRDSLRAAQCIPELELDVDWHRELAGSSRHDLERLHRLGDKFVRRRYFRSAYACYTNALDVIKFSLPVADTFEFIYKRHLAAVKLGAHEFARQDALQLMFSFPTLARSYIIAAQFFDAQQDPASAEFVCERGTKMAASGDEYYPALTSYLTFAQLRRQTTPILVPDSLTPPSDIILRFPEEILLEILAYIPLSQRYEMMRVCHAWSSAIRNCCTETLEHLDLERYPGPITYIRLYNILKSCQHCVTDISLGALAVADKEKCMKLVFFGITATDDECLDLKHVRSLRINTSTSLFTWIGYLQAQFSWSLFPQVEELRVRIENAPDVVNFLARGGLPRLRVLECYAAHQVIHADEEIVFLKEDIIYNRQPQLKVLKLGCVSNEPRFPYTQSQKPTIISQASLLKVLQLLPGLEEFHCVNVNTRQITMDMWTRNRACLRLMLRTLTPELRVLNLSYSSLRAMPFLPPTCEVIKLDCCPDLCVRSCKTFRATQYYDDVLTSEGDGYFLVNIPDEYIGVREVSLARSTAPISKIFDGLARCNGDNLTSLNLHGCRTIDFMAPLPETASDFVKYHALYGFDILPTIFTVAELIVHRFPNLKILNVGCNNTVTNRTLDTFSMLDDLLELDVSCTAATHAGISALITGRSFETANAAVVAVVNEPIRIRRLTMSWDQLTKAAIEGLQNLNVALTIVERDVSYVDGNENEVLNHCRLSHCATSLW